jgi:hypothetical protein
MAFDATIGGAAANSYAPSADATAYFADRPTSALWAAVADKMVSLVRATDYLDLLKFSGLRAESTQALSHPRSQLYNREGDGYIASTEIAPDILKALYELALYLETNAASFVEADTVTEVKVGPIGIKLDKKTFGEYSSLPLNVQRLIDPYLKRGGSRRLTLTRG